MTELLIRHGEWVVVCDGAKALILENAGDTKFPNLRTIEVFEQEDLPTHALGADAPGRTNNSVGSNKS
ncbi:MAG TPA: host attachment protein, partial [Burkholderiales bacterium]|nr:host attachment protein [Burkholderiales bacterium]